MKKKEKNKTEGEKVNKKEQDARTNQQKTGQNKEEKQTSSQKENGEPANQAADADIIADYQRQIEAKEASLNEANDKFLRLFSEFDNYRKRVARERIELTKTAAEGVIASLLPVLDDLERASQIETEVKDGSLQEGIKLIYNKFKAILRQKGIEEIDTQGKEFDTDFHEAITHIPASDEKQKGKVVEEVQKGYLLNGKVIRYAKVVVAN